MNNAEIIQNLRKQVGELIRENDDLKVYAKALEDALGSTNRKLTEVFETLCDQSMELTNFHQNGETIPVDTFFEENDWEPVHVKLSNSSEKHNEL